MMIKDQMYFDGKSDLGDPRVLEDPSKILSKFGLSPNQSKIYLCLSRLGTKTASQLSKTLDIPRTEVYHLLKTLQEKGCVTSINEKPMKFGSVDIDIFLQRKDKLKKIKIQKLEEILLVIQKLKLVNNFNTEPKKISKNFPMSK